MRNRSSPHACAVPTRLSNISDLHNGTKKQTRVRLNELQGQLIACDRTAPSYLRFCFFIDLVLVERSNSTSGRSSFESDRSELRATSPRLRLTRAAEKEGYSTWRMPDA